MNELVNEVVAVEQAAIADLKSAEQKLAAQVDVLKTKDEGKQDSEPKSN